MESFFPLTEFGSLGYETAHTDYAVFGESRKVQLDAGSSFEAAARIL